jgi:hypothetical protein
MGWTFSTSWKSKEVLIEYLRSEKRVGTEYKLLHSSVVGNNHWYLFRCPNGVVIIGLDLMQSGGGDGWGYKAIDETMGPTEINCPISYLDKAGPATGYADEWRKRVREYHARRSAAPTPKAGLIVRHGGQEFKLLDTAGNRLGWRVERVIDGALFRMPAKQLSKALLNTVLPTPHS